MESVSSAVVFILFLLGSVVGGMEDGTFESRFEYEYKVLKQLVMLEMESNELRGMVTSLTSRLEDANTVIQNLNASMRNVATGNTYIRWGRKSCPGGTGARPLYDGFAGGSWFSHAGEATTTCACRGTRCWSTYREEVEAISTGPNMKMAGQFGTN
ncbi:uncharacterized protein LOC128228601 [Mya arenaria]|uniref:uncharacterized protein LOC128228601 n=1 Tax=Mya arenaria TaxID=6604 RepID=UPI0022E5047C|nr:uncharacterized protein LOC128228601 [Mya arenaria]